MLGSVLRFHIVVIETNEKLAVLNTITKILLKYLDHLVGFCDFLNKDVLGNRIETIEKEP